MWTIWLIYSLKSCSLMYWGCFCCQAIKLVQCLCWIFKLPCQPDTWNVNNWWCCFPVGIWHKGIPGSLLLALTYYWQNIMVFGSSLARDLRTVLSWSLKPPLGLLSQSVQQQIYGEVLDRLSCSFAVLKPNMWPVLYKTWQKKQWNAWCFVFSSTWFGFSCSVVTNVLFKAWI